MNYVRDSRARTGRLSRHSRSIRQGALRELELLPLPPVTGLLFTMIRRNRCYGEWLGWHEYRAEIASTAFGMKTRPPSGRNLQPEARYAQAVARWQEAQGDLDVDGVIGIETLRRLHLAHPILALEHSLRGLDSLDMEPSRPHWIEWIASPNHLSRNGSTITHIIYHATSGPSLKNAVASFVAGDLSAHYVVGRDGRIVQMVDLSRAAQHAGRLQGEPGDADYVSANPYSIGIEIVNLGWLRRRGDTWRVRVPGTRRTVQRTCEHNICTARGRAYTGDTQQALESYYRTSNSLWQPYTAAQMNALIRLTRFLVSCIPTITHITGHEHIGRWGHKKADPGGAFDWPRIKRALSGWFLGHICDSDADPDHTGTLQTDDSGRILIPGCP